MDKKKNIERDRKLLMRLGGYSKVARMTNKSPQCVFNWGKRGIPPRVKLDFPELFLKKDA
ncbi:hypothetical protein PL75_03365 [Neisseria arctica]|uniref:Cro/Cl family transcriptional regulator n=2 Tax=Neisseria arctica TaxID=1470200 RepID=A0A0J0YTE8_9NEIS|nr:hypothetical protein PL75_03365 [Neisseria arctica]